MFKTIEAKLTTFENLNGGAKEAVAEYLGERCLLTGNIWLVTGKSSRNFVDLARESGRAAIQTDPKLRQFRQQLDLIACEDRHANEVTLTITSSRVLDRQKDADEAEHRILRGTNALLRGIGLELPLPATACAISALSLQNN